MRARARRGLRRRRVLVRRRVPRRAQSRVAAAVDAAGARAGDAGPGGTGRREMHEKCGLARGGGRGAEARGRRRRSGHDLRQVRRREGGAGDDARRRCRRDEARAERGPVRRDLRAAHAGPVRRPAGPSPLRQGHVGLPRAAARGRDRERGARRGRAGRGLRPAGLRDGLARRVAPPELDDPVLPEALVGAIGAGLRVARLLHVRGVARRRVGCGRGDGDGRPSRAPRGRRRRAGPPGVLRRDLRRVPRRHTVRVAGDLGLRRQNPRPRRQRPGGALRRAGLGRFARPRRVAAVPGLARVPRRRGRFNPPPTKDILLALGHARQPARRRARVRGAARGRRRTGPSVPRL